MRHPLLIMLFLVLRVTFAAGFVWILHQDGPALANVTLKVKSRYNCLFAKHSHLIYHAQSTENELYGQTISNHST